MPRGKFCYAKEHTQHTQAHAHTHNCAALKSMQSISATIQCTQTVASMCMFVCMPNALTHTYVLYTIRT